MNRLMMQEFGVALGLWTLEDQSTDVYTTTVRDFTKDISVYQMHISRDGAPFVQFKAKGTGLIPVLRYLHAIVAYTITGRSYSQMVITTTNVEILSYLYRSISVDLTYVFARQVRDCASSTQKKSLSPSLFITQVVRYFDIDTSTTRRCSTTMILLDQMILRNIHMLRRVGDHFVIREILVDEPPVPEDEVPEEPLLSPHQVRHQSMPNATEPSSSVFTYHPENTFKRFIVTSLTQQCESITQLTSQFQRTEQQVDRIFRHLNLSDDASETCRTLSSQRSRQNFQYFCFILFYCCTLNIYF